MKIDYVAIGKRIRELRKEKQWTQDKLSYEADISKTHMWSYTKKVDRDKH